MAEEQALDRVHRMGQMREVVATRYVVKDSIEEVRDLGALPVTSLKLIYCELQYVVLVQEMKSRIIKQSFEREGGVENLSPRERFLKVGCGRNEKVKVSCADMVTSTWRSLDETNVGTMPNRILNVERGRFRYSRLVIGRGETLLGSHQTRFFDITMCQQAH